MDLPIGIQLAQVQVGFDPVSGQVADARHGIVVDPLMEGTQGDEKGKYKVRELTIGIDGCFDRRGHRILHRHGFSIAEPLRPYDPRGFNAFLLYCSDAQGASVPFGARRTTAMMRGHRSANRF